MATSVALICVPSKYIATFNTDSSVLGLNKIYETVGGVFAISRHGWLIQAFNKIACHYQIPGLNFLAIMSSSDMSATLDQEEVERLVKILNSTIAHLKTHPEVLTNLFEQTGISNHEMLAELNKTVYFGQAMTVSGEEGDHVLYLIEFIKRFYELLLFAASQKSGVILGCFH